MKAILTAFPEWKISLKVLAAPALPRTLVSTAVAGDVRKVDEGRPFLPQSSCPSSLGNGKCRPSISFEGEGIYDTDLGIMWLANANLAMGNTFGVEGHCRH